MLATRIRQKDGTFYFISYKATDLLDRVRFTSRYYFEGDKIEPEESGDDEVARFIAGIEKNDKGFQRLLSRKKVRDIVNFYETAISQPLIPGTVLLFTAEALRFEPVSGYQAVGNLSEPEGKYLVIDGQHRLAGLYFFRDKHPDQIDEIEPDPAAAESLHSGVIEFFLERFQAPEGFLDRLAEGAGGFSPALGPHQGPEHRVVDVAAAVIPNRGANGFGNTVQIADQILGGFFRQLRVLFKRQMITPGGEDFFLEGTARMAEGLVVKSARRGPDLQRAFQQPGISLWNRITDAAPFWTFLMQRRGERAGVFLRQLFESTGRDSAPDALFRAAEIGRYWHEYSRALMYQPPFESLDNSDELALRPDYQVSVAQLRSIPRRTVQHIDGVILAPLSSTRIDLYVPLAEYLDLELLSRSGQYPPGLEATLILSPNGQVVDWTGQWHYQLCRTLSRPCRDQRRHPTVTSVQVILSNRDPQLPLEVELIASSSNSHWIAESVHIDNATLPVLGDLELLLLDDKTLQLNARRAWFDWNEGFYPYAPSRFARKMVIDYLKSHASFRGSARYQVTRRRSESDQGPLLLRLDTRRIQEGNYHATPFGFIVQRDPHWYRLGGRFRSQATAFLNEMERWEQNPPGDFGPRASAVFKRIMQLEDPIFYTYAEGAGYERLTLLFKNMRIVFRPAES